ncbi:Ser/Thr protein kinase [Cryptosporidium ryanae]|uniref:Ser/Thr protein kinase n=1 Tax=Cryptosporidium ryanae TaxID=515981 RepID=UPI003519F0CE|nr:Ser/Thr protein kinase [Cryptosporidium ryanae]
MRSLLKENQKPFFNRQVIDISPKKNENSEKFKNNDYCDGNGIWSKFVGLMKNSLNIPLINKNINSNRYLNEIEEKGSDSKTHINDILLRKNFEKISDRKTKICMKEQREPNFMVNRRNNYKKNTTGGTSGSSSFVLPSSMSCSVSHQLSNNGNSIGISFAEQILNCNNKEYNNRNLTNVPTTPTTLDGSSTTTSPAFTNIQFSSPSTNNTRKQVETPNSKKYESIESMSSFHFKDEYYYKKKNHAVDFSADDSHLDNIMDIINEKIILNDFEKESDSRVNYVKLLNSNLALNVNKEEINNKGFFGGNNNLFEDEFKKNLFGSKYINSSILNSEASLFLPSSQKNDNICYSWREAKQLISKLKSSTKIYRYNNVPFYEWIHEKIPTLGASPTSCRVQEMFKSIVKSKENNRHDTTLFVKRIPRNIWAKQWEMHEIWDGDYVTDGEDFVMEAAALAFLQTHSENITPKLYAILEHKDESIQENVPHSGNIKARSSCDYLLNKDTTHIILVSEYYGEDLLDYLDKCEKQNKALSNREKKELQYNLVVIMDKLHKKGLSHLDFTPENILIGPNGINVCDFAKSTPIITNNPRHTHYCKKPAMSLIEDFNSSNMSFNFINPPPEAYYEFESCEPTVGKGAYMPPECWRIFWKLEENKIQYPLEELMENENTLFNNQNYCINYISNNNDDNTNRRCIELSDRSQFYFNVRMADVYMLGIIMFWIWSDGGIWKYSDVRQDHRYQNLVFSDLNFDVFRECRTWDKPLKNLLRKMLEPEPNKRITLSEVLKDPWWEFDTE